MYALYAPPISSLLLDDPAKWARACTLRVIRQKLPALAVSPLPANFMNPVDT